MSVFDYSIVFAYLGALFGWAIYIGRGQSAEDFLVFSRSAPFFLVLFSTVSTWVGVGTTVATASSGYTTGLSLGFTASAGGILGAIGAAWFAPRLKRFGDVYHCHTIGDFFQVRYSTSSRLAASSVILFIYTLLTGAQLLGLSAILRVWTDSTPLYIVIFAAISTVIYTAFAGIKSDFYTDSIHFVLMLVVLFFILLPLSLIAVGGLEGLSALPPTYFDPFAYGGFAFFIAGLIFGAGSIFVTMELWQRIYASSTERTARLALGCSILIIVAFYGISAFLGMVARILLPDLPDSDLALFTLMNDLLPHGVLGLGVAALMAILISTLNSTLMVSSATLAKDFLYHLPHAAPDRLLFLSRISTVLTGTLGLFVAFLFPDIVTLSVNGMFMLLILLPAIVGGFFWKRATTIAASTSIILGMAITGGFMIVDATTAFIPGFIVSVIAFVLISLFSRHSETEIVIVTEKGEPPLPKTNAFSEV